MTRRIGTLLCLFATLACAQDRPDPFVGTFQNDQIALTLAGARGSYSGTVTYQGRSFPVTVRTIARVTTGAFQMDGESVVFALTPTETGVQVMAAGATYRLDRRTPGSPRGAAPGSAAPKPGPNSIVGAWRNAQGYARFNADGTGNVDGTPGRYEIDGGQLTLIGAQGRVVLPFEVKGDTLTLTVNGAPVVLNRVVEQAGGNGVRPELVGKWCWVSIVNAQQGARTSNQCFVLNPDGSYQYSGETDSYNPYGGATTQQGDAGTWTATDNTLTANSRSRGTTVYTLEKRNHPKTGDPMLVLDGQPFVTYYKHAPWY